MGEENGAVVPVDQSADFLGFDFEGVRVDVDVFAAYEAFGKIDLAHAGDPWFCWSCRQTVAIDMEAEAPACPSCGCTEPDKLRKDEAWLDDVAAYVVRLGVPRCSRRAAVLVYGRVCEAMEAVKKNRTPTLE